MFPRSSQFGDGLFETIRMFEGRLPFLPLHFQRLQQGIKLIGLSPAPWESCEDLAQWLIAQTDSSSPNLRLRLTVSREGAGAYLPISNAAAVDLAISPLNAARFEAHPKGLLLGDAQDIRLSYDVLSPFKTCSALPQVLAARQAATQGWDAALLFNTNDRVACAHHANLFIVNTNNRLILTPPLSEAAKAGTIRALLLQHNALPDYTIAEQALTPSDLLAADEILLTNAIIGIQPVVAYRNRRYLKREACHQLLNILNQRLLTGL